MGFPHDFLWGGDISANQAEGAWNVDGKSPNESDYTTIGTKSSPRRIYFEKQDGMIGCTTMFQRDIPKGAKYIIKPDENYPNHRGCDFYYHYKEDIGYFAEMGFKALNLSISWARILPDGIKGGTNEKGIRFYHNVFAELKKHNIEPIVHLYKYDMPAFFVEQHDGWNNRSLIEEFLAFAKICFEEYKDYVRYWNTFNEINILQVMAFTYKEPEKIQRFYQELHHQLVASAKAVSLAHKINPENKVGCMCSGIVAYPLTSSPSDQIACQKFQQDDFFYAADVFVRGKYPSYSKRLWNELGININITDEDLVALENGKVDFLSFSYYMSLVISSKPDEDLEKSGGNLATGIKNPYLEYSDWGWAMDHEGLKFFLHQLYDRYQIPLLNVENGLGAVDKLEEDGLVHDDYRIEYHRNHVKAMGEAIDEGVDLFGYTTWGCIDLIAFSTGEMSKRYGFIYVDVDDEGNGTYKRYKKDSFYWYQKCISSNGTELD